MSPAQKRRRQAARAANSPDTSRSYSRRKTTLMPSDLSQLSRDRILGYGAAVGALLGLAGLNIASLIIVVALGYAAAALLGPVEKRDKRLRQAGWLAGAMAGLMAVMVAIVLGLAASRPTEDGVSAFAYLPMGSASLILATASTLALALAAVFAASAFRQEGAARHRLLSRAACCVLFYFIILLPATVVDASGPGSVGVFWSAPVDYAVLLLNILAAVAVALAFLWAAESTQIDSAHSTIRLAHAQREYLLLVAAVSLTTAQVLGLLSLDWGVLNGPSGATSSDIFAAGAAYVARRVLPLVLSVAAAAAFLVSSRRVGWTRGQWSNRLDKTSTDEAPDGATQAISEIHPEPGRLSLTWVAEFCLSWRLPLLYGWLIALVAACSFLGWYGFGVALPAAVHYLWMLLHARRSRAR